MRATPEEKLETIRLVEGSSLGVKRTLAELDVARSTFYRWYRAYVEHGFDGLAPCESQQRRCWHQIPDAERERAVEAVVARTEL